MRMKTLELAFLAAFALAVTGGIAHGADATATMAAAAKNFYDAYAGFHPSDGIPDAKDRAKYAPFITTDLEKLLTAGDAAEESFHKANKDSPPLIEGDLFTSNFEGATTFAVGPCAGDSKEGHCAIHLVYDDRKDKPVVWTDTVFLASTQAGWRVDDIAYGAPWEFGNKGRLTTTLRSAVRNAGD